MLSLNRIYNSTPPRKQRTFCCVNPYFSPLHYLKGFCFRTNLKLLFCSEKYFLKFFNFMLLMVKYASIVGGNEAQKNSLSTYYCWNEKKKMIFNLITFSLCFWLSQWRTWAQIFNTIFLKAFIRFPFIISRLLFFQFFKFKAFCQRNFFIEFNLL